MLTDKLKKYFDEMYDILEIKIVSFFALKRVLKSIRTSKKHWLSWQFRAIDFGSVDVQPSYNYSFILQDNALFQCVAMQCNAL